MTRRIASAGKFIARKDAPTMAEYGLLLAPIAIVVAIADATVIGTGISKPFRNASGSI